MFLFKAAGWLDTKYWALINAVEISVMNSIYKKLARCLNDWENYETEREYSDALTLKLCVFQFINSYSSLLYIAFLKQYFEGCDDGNCMAELQLQISYIFLITLGLNLVELGVP